MSKFQIILISIFAFLAVGGLMIFATFKGKSNQSSAPVVVWGTLDLATMNSFLADAIDSEATGVKVSYVQKKESTFDQELVEAIATGRGPDMVLVPQDHILKNENKLRVISYDSYSEKDFKNNFVQAASIYQRTGGVIAIPFAIDPMVMYWNRDIFNNAAVAKPPKTWSEVTNLVPTLTQKNSSLSILQSTIALGEYQNIAHAKDIFAMMLLQTGNPIVVVNSDNTAASTLAYAGLAVKTLDFYTQFANPIKESYTWNRSLLGSRELFIANRLALYLGYASEYNQLRAKNPNLNFDVTYVPQPQQATDAQPTNTTIATIYGMAITNVSSNANDYAVLGTLSNARNVALWNSRSGMPSVRRDVSTAKSDSAASVVFSTSAFWSKAWLDPDGAVTSGIFQRMIEDMTSGRATNAFSAVAQADSELGVILNK